MPPRQGRIRGVLVGRGQGRKAAEIDIQIKLRQLQARMEAMERKTSDNTDNSDEEESSEDEREEVAEEVKVLKMLMKASNIPRVEVPIYEGNINVEEIMDWINALNKYFDFEEVEDKKKVRYAVTKLKGNETIWWDELQIYRERRGKPKIKSWDKMLYKIKSQFNMPKYYWLNLIRQLQNLRQQGMIVKEYT